MKQTNPQCTNPVEQKERVLRFVRLRKDGMSVKTAARRVGSGREQIRNWAKQHNITLPS